MDYAGHRVDVSAPGLSHRAAAARPHYPSYQPPPSYLPPYHPRPNPNPSPAPAPVPGNNPYSTAVTGPYPCYGGPAAVPYSDPGVGRSGMPSQNYSSTGGGYLIEPYPTPAAAAPSGLGEAAAPSSCPCLGRTARPPAYYNAVDGGGGGHGQTVAPYSDPGLSQATRPPAYCNAVGGGRGGYGHTVPQYSDPGLGRAVRPPAYYNTVDGGGGGYGHIVPPYSDPGLGRVARPPAYNNVADGGGGGYGQTVPPYSDPGLGRVARPPAYYNAVEGGSGGGYGHSFSAKEAIQQYGVDPQLHGPSEVIRQYGVDPHLSRIPTWSSNGLVPTIQPSHTHLLQSNGAPITPSGDITWGPQKRTNPGQSVHCEVCKIDCNNNEVLISHKQGKKHKQNLLKLQEAITAKPAGAPPGVLIDDKDKESSVTEKEKVVRERKKKRAAVQTATEEDLEVKKKRVLEGGGAASEMKVCTICNVVVNSQQVLDCHLSGLKHAAMVKKHLGS